MTAEVVRLVSLDEMAVADVVALLEEMLEDAKAGVIESIAIAAVRFDNSTMVSTSSSRNMAALLGSVVILQDAVMRRLNE